MAQTLQNLGLSPEQIAKRKNSIGGSDANVIMSGDEEKIFKLWEIKTGRAEPEDLSDILAVQMGSWTEDFNKQWFEKETDLTVLHCGREYICKNHSWRTCTADGIIDQTIAKSSKDYTVWEAKHTGTARNIDGQFKQLNIDILVDLYQPQLQHNMAVTGLDKAVLSVFFGNAKWDWALVESNPFYQHRLLEQEEKFWQCVQDDVPPEGFERIDPPEPAQRLRVVDMTGNNEWGSNADIWLENKTAEKKFKTAAKDLKAMLPNDVREASGHGIIIKRAKNNSLRISEVKG